MQPHYYLMQFYKMPNSIKIFKLNCLYQLLKISTPSHILRPWLKCRIQVTRLNVFPFSHSEKAVFDRPVFSILCD